MVYVSGSEGRVPNIPSFATLFDMAQRGDGVARDAIYALSFLRLRSIASSLLCRERRNHTLQATALVGELFLKLERLHLRILDEDHFFRLSARAMRQVLIDYARAKRQERRVPADVVPELLNRSAVTDTESLLTVRMVFRRLEELDPVAASAVWLRSVEGLTLAQVSSMQGREVWRVRADYDFGIQWLADRIARHTPSSSKASS
jgi:RNA polymerase sigma factor (TIGR02999 family)